MQIQIVHFTKQCYIQYRYLNEKFWGGFYTTFCKIIISTQIICATPNSRPPPGVTRRVCHSSFRPPGGSVCVLICLPRTQESPHCFDTQNKERQHYALTIPVSKFTITIIALWPPTSAHLTWQQFSGKSMPSNIDHKSGFTWSVNAIQKLVHSLKSTPSSQVEMETHRGYVFLNWLCHSGGVNLTFQVKLGSLCPGPFASMRSTGGWIWHVLTSEMMGWLTKVKRSHPCAVWLWMCAQVGLVGVVLIYLYPLELDFPANFLQNGKKMAPNFTCSLSGSSWQCSQVSFI